MGKLILHDFYCTSCGSKGISIQRIKGKMREPGHLKKIWCLKCKRETNHAEVLEYGKYTYDDFLIEFENGNFSDEGLRKEPYKQFISDFERREI